MVVKEQSGTRTDMTEKFEEARRYNIWRLSPAATGTSMAQAQGGLRYGRCGSRRGERLGVISNRCKSMGMRSVNVAAV